MIIERDFDHQLWEVALTSKSSIRVLRGVSEEAEALSDPSTDCEQFQRVLGFTSFLIKEAAVRAPDLHGHGDVGHPISFRGQDVSEFIDLLGLARVVPVESDPDSLVTDIIRSDFVNHITEARRQTTDPLEASQLDIDRDRLLSPASWIIDFANTNPNNYGANLRQAV